MLYTILCWSVFSVSNSPVWFDTHSDGEGYNWGHLSRETPCCFPNTSNRPSSNWMRMWLQPLLIVPFEHVDSPTSSSTRRRHICREDCWGFNEFNYCCVKYLHKNCELFLICSGTTEMTLHTHTICGFHLLQLLSSVISNVLKSSVLYQAWTMSEQT